MMQDDHQLGTDVAHTSTQAAANENPAVSLWPDDGGLPFLQFGKVKVFDALAHDKGPSYHQDCADSHACWQALNSDRRRFTARLKKFLNEAATPTTTSSSASGAGATVDTFVRKFQTAMGFPFPAPMTGDSIAAGSDGTKSNTVFFQQLSKSLLESSTHRTAHHPYDLSAPSSSAQPVESGASTQTT
jgi:hypothetical protein